ncbi:LysM peptidoglycan-binding domain-containing protein [Desulfovibrio sp. OttesenSCG-928-A18]|nr:LysM peptidoglycan-binding domain-containing protein [Desulfovibrio sp. OttesenSCG-928-A18]
MPAFQSMVMHGPKGSGEYGGATDAPGLLKRAVSLDIARSAEAALPSRTSPAGGGVFAQSPLLRSLCFLPLFACLFALASLLLGGCATREEPEPTLKYKADMEEMMPIPYTPRDDGLPLTPDELHAFKTVSDLDRHLSEEDAQIVELHFKFFVHQHRRTLERYVERSSRFLPYVRKIFSDRGIPPDVAYLFMVESGGNPNARSPANAAGLWQFIPSTGRKFNLSQDSWIDERRDPYKATLAAADYLLMLNNMFSNWHLAIAAYNAGEGKVGKALDGTGAKDFFELCRLDAKLEEKLRLRDETRDYVPRLIAMAKIMRNLRRLGFSEPTPAMAWNLVPMNVPPGTNLSGLAQSLDLPWDEFSGMNPAFRRTASPPYRDSTAYVPPEKLAAAVSWVASKEARIFADWKEHTVRKGDSLTSIAKRYGVSVAAIREANNISKLPKSGTSLIIPGKGRSAPVYDALPDSQASASAGTYTVRSGDTLYELARAWGTTVDSIRLANRMSPSQTALRPGQRINIPGNSRQRPAAAAPRAASPAAAALNATGGGTYVVQPGDTISHIAVLTDSTSSAICEANMLDCLRPLIRPGQTLRIPGKTGSLNSPAAATVQPGARSQPGKAAPVSKAASAKSRSVTVQAGDSLYNIARSHGVSVEALQKANKLGKSTKLKIGQTLIIP